MEMKMGRCYMDGAYEVAEVLMQGGMLERWMNEGEEYPHTLHHTLASWYLYQPQPSAEDIVGVVDLCRKGGWYSLTFKIRRGKEMLAAWFNQHSSPRVRVGNVEGGSVLWLFCGGCNKQIYLPWDSLGHCGGPLVREAVAPAPDAPENQCTRAVQRIDGGADHRPPSQRDEGSVGTDSKESNRRASAG
jgi:hypothetical protein